jgi:hypothetical protein
MCEKIYNTRSVIHLNNFQKYVKSDFFKLIGSKTFVQSSFSHSLKLYQLSKKPVYNCIGNLTFLCLQTQNSGVGVEGGGLLYIRIQFPFILCTYTIYTIYEHHRAYNT